MTIPQWFALFGTQSQAPQTHAEAVDRANAERAAKGLEPLTDKLPTPPAVPGAVTLTEEMMKANLERAAAFRLARQQAEAVKAATAR